MDLPVNRGQNGKWCKGLKNKNNVIEWDRIVLRLLCHDLPVFYGIMYNGKDALKKGF